MTVLWSRDSVGAPLVNGPDRLNRRRLLQAAGAASLATALRFDPVAASGGNRLLTRPVHQGTPGSELADEVVVDLAVEPPSLDPAIVYDNDGWSVVHSIYDSLVQYRPDGQFEPVLAESVTQIDPLIWEVKLRQGIMFHNGEPFDAKSVAFSIAHIVAEETASTLAGTFQVISEVREIDPYTVHLALSQPAPWLPSQLAPWIAALPPQYAADPANDFGANPVGTGPYRFVEWTQGDSVALEVNPDYFAASPKGQAIAQRVTFRFVSEAGTRVADLLSGSAHLVRDVPVDQIEAVNNGGATVVETPVSGLAFVRIATDTKPFDDVRVRQALNYAVDVDTIVEALLAGNGTRLPNLFVEGGLGYDPSLAPYEFDPDKAKSLLTEAGFEDGFDTVLEYTTAQREDLVAAVAGQLDAVGVRAELRAVETATFNDTWADPNTAPLRFLTWRPMFDPFTLLSLLISGSGFMSRHQNERAQPLIDAGAAETDPTKRAEIYRELGQVLRDEPTGIYLYNLTALYGAAADLPAWTPRADDYIIPTHRNDG